MKSGFSDCYVNESLHYTFSFEKMYRTSFAFAQDTKNEENFTVKIISEEFFRGVFVTWLGEKQIIMH